VYFIPKIRRLALLVIHYSKTNQPEKVEETLQLIPCTIRPEVENCNSFCVMKFCQLVYMLHDAYPLKRYLEIYDATVSVNYHHIFSKRNLNVLKIYRAFVAASDGDIAQAQSILDSYNPLYIIPEHKQINETHFRSVQRYITRQADKLIKTGKLS